MIGIILLAHNNLHRTEQVARHFASQNCPVVLHIDLHTNADAFENLKQALADEPLVKFCKRVHCEWGRFSLVQATLNAARLMLETWPDVGHVCLMSGSCLPIKPVKTIQKFFADHPDTDFIESVSAEDDAWVFGGLSSERFKYYFPFSWLRHRWLFDRSVELQRKLGVKRRMPAHLKPYIGSQWWCLSSKTLQGILDDPELDKINRFFRLTWIPDETYFQSLVRKHSDKVFSKVLTLARFDHQGKPFIFHNDHLDDLLKNDALFARKIWAGADDLYRELLKPKGLKIPAKPDNRPLELMMRKATNLRAKGREGLISQSRFPAYAYDNYKFARPYLVLDGPDLLVPDLVQKMQGDAGLELHGLLFEPNKLEFADSSQFFGGNVKCDLRIRDFNQRQFLGNLIWTRRHISQSFLMRLRRMDSAVWLSLLDYSAQILYIRDAWIIDFIQQNLHQPDKFLQRLDLRVIQQRKAASKLAWTRQINAELESFYIADILESPDLIAARVDGILPARTRFLEYFTSDEVKAGLESFFAKAERSELPLEKFDDYQSLRARVLPLIA